MDRDRNLLFGVFAVRLKGIAPQDLMDAAAQWALDPGRDISERLVEARIITAQDREVLLQLVDGAIQAHEGRSKDALASLGGMKAVEDSFMGSLQETAEGLSWVIATKTAPLGQFRQQEIPIVREVPGRYTRPSERARGGMGRILIVHDEQLEREIVLKELLPSKSASGDKDVPPTPVRQTGELLARFLREAKVTGQLEHPSIVPVYELGSREDGSVYYTMKLVRGETLGDKLKKAETLEERFRYLQHFADLCQAMAYAHSRGVIHRDLKPSNVMIGEFGETVVIDWGLAKITGQDDANEERLKKSLVKFKEEQDQADVTADGEVLGTPLYMSPEQARGEIQTIDERSDVYSLGAILYQILAGRTPFSGRSTAEILQRVAHEIPEPVERALPDCPPELAAICNRAMASEAGERYRNAKLLAEEVQNYLTGALVSAYSYSFFELLRRYWRRHRTLMSVSAAFTAALLVLAVWSYVNISRARDRESAQRQVAERLGYANGIQLAQQFIEVNNLDAANATLARLPEDQRQWEWFHLDKRANPSTATLPDTTIAVWSALGNSLLTAHPERPLMLYDARSFSELGKIDTDLALLNTLALDSQGNTAALAGADNLIRVYDVKLGTLLFKLSGHIGPIYDVRFSADDSRLISYAKDGAVKVWDAKAGILVATLTREGYRAKLHGLDATGQYVLGGFDATAPGESTEEAIAWLYDLNAQALLFEAPGQWIGYDTATANAFVLQDGAITEWKPTENRFLKTWPTDANLIAHGTLSPDGKLLASCTAEGAIRVHTTADGANRSTISTGAKQKWLRFSPDGGLLLTAAASKPELALWDTAKGTLRRVLRGHRLDILAANFSPDGRFIASTSLDRTARVWATTQDTLSQSLHTPSNQARNVRVSADGRRGAIIEPGGLHTVLDLPGGQRQSVQAVPSSNPDCLAITPDGQRVALLTGTSTIAVWNVEANEISGLFRGHMGPVSAISYQPGPGLFVSASLDGKISRWSAQDRQEQDALTLNEGQPQALACSSTMIAIGTREGAVFRWRPGEPEAEALGVPAAQPVTAIAVDNSDRILVATSNGLLIAYDPVARNWRAPYRAYSAGIDDMALEESNGRVFTAAAREGLSVFSWPELDSLVTISPNSKQSNFRGLAYCAPEQTLFTACLKEGLTRWRGQEPESLPAILPPSGATTSVPVIAIVATGDLESALERAVAQPGELQRIHGFHPMRALGLQIDDFLVEIDGATVANDGEVRIALETRLQSGSSEDLRLGLQRGGDLYAYRWQSFEPERMTVPVTVDRDTLRAVLQRYRDSTAGGAIGAMSGNAAYHALHGIDVATEDTLPGIVVSAKTDEYGAFVSALNNAATDLIVEIDGSPANSMGSMESTVNQLLERLDAGTLQNYAVTLKRDAFKTLQIEYTVVPAN
ncbi:MAG: protein kinase [Candidatus Hydrogenedentes bacterium]|nr:protein kinase [Candidatus Hydrogenedentota bacterium]